MHLETSQPFVERAFRQLLRCGFRAGGFARFHCGDCGLDRLVALSCKGRALCPSCGGRRMAERTAYLVDRLIRMRTVEERFPRRGVDIDRGEFDPFTASLQEARRPWPSIRRKRKWIGQ